MIFWNLDNSANTTDPGGAFPWDSIAKVTNSTATSISGSAVYLGNGYLLTANHVTFNSSLQYVSFDGATAYAVDTNFKSGSRFAGKQVAPNVDLAVIKLTTTPIGIDGVSLLTTPTELIAPATLVGWGVGRNPSVALSSPSVAWGNSTTSAKRWGLNVPRTTMNVAYQSGSYEAIVSIVGGDGISFNPDGLGNSEAAATLYDSGSGLFQFLAGNWWLIGTTTGVETNGTSIFGNDRLSAPRGDRNFFVRTSTYSSQIMPLIPEADGFYFLALVLLYPVIVRILRRTKNRSL